VEPGQRIWYVIRMKATVFEQPKRGKSPVRWTVGGIAIGGGADGECERSELEHR